MNEETVGLFSVVSASPFGVVRIGVVFRAATTSTELLRVVNAAALIGVFNVVVMVVAAAVVGICEVGIEVLKTDEVVRADTVGVALVG